MTATEYVNGLCKAAKEAQTVLSCASTEEKNKALLAVAGALKASKAEILKANNEDISAAGENGVPVTMIDRLRLTEERIDGIANAVCDVVALPDPCGNGTVTTRPNGLKITAMSVPLGVIGIIYEARPNVTVDAAALCLKSGNAAVLKGGKEAICTNRAIMKVIKGALSGTAVPPESVMLIESTDRAATTALMNARGLIDVLIPRGGKGLIKAVVEGAGVPVIETGAGNCHVYVDASADMKKAVAVCINAKMSRPSVCNAAETLLVHSGIADSFLPEFARAVGGKLEIRGDERTLSVLTGAIEGTDVSVVRASEEDFATEFNDYVLAVKVVDGVDEAIAHVRSYTTGHSEAIITEDMGAAKRFTQGIDAAAVYVNASTRFTDGGEFGFGAEIGISTQKLHARGPMGLNELTTVKYVVEGDGQIR